MKPKSVQRDIKPSQTRSAGDAPAIGKVARMAGVGQPRARKRGHDRSALDSSIAQTRRQTLWIWSGALAILSLLAIGVAMMNWIRTQKNRDVTGPLFVAEAEIPVENVGFPAPSESEAIQLVKSALENRDLAKIQQLFRVGNTSPVEILRFLTELEETDGPVKNYDWMRNMDANGMSLEGVLVTFDHPEKTVNRLAILTPDNNGNWQTDFAAFARLTEPKLDEIIQQRADQGVVRIYTSKDNYYNGPFADDMMWNCFGIASPDTDQLLLGYCKIGSAQAQALELMLSADQKMVRAILELKRITGGEARQFEITRVLAEDWVIGETPFDERFR